MTIEVGRSDYSVVMESHDDRFPFPQVEKRPFGIGVYYLEPEKRINGIIQRAAAEQGATPNIVTYYGPSKDGQGMIFEQAEGDLEKAEPLVPTEFGSMIIQITDAVKYLDSLHISHRDLRRPANIFYFENGIYKIGDFNLSVIVAEDEQTYNAEAFRLALQIYIGEKVLGHTDVLDSLIDVHSEVEAADSSKLNPHAREIILKFFETTREEVTVEMLQNFGKEFAESGIDGWI